MHELFITAAIPSPKVAEVLQVLALYTHTRPAQFFRRKVEFKGPKGPQYGGPPLPGFSKELIMPQNINPSEIEKEKKRIEGWRLLDEQVRKMPYYIATIWMEDLRLGATTSGDVNSRPGTVRFVGVPEFGPQPDPVVSRLFIQIENDVGIPKKLESAGYVRFSEVFAEVWRCTHNRMSFELMRIMVNPETGQIDANQLPEQGTVHAAYGRKWILTVKVEIVDGTKPELMTEARNLLGTVVRDMGKYVDFGQLSFETLDPRVKYKE